MWTGVPICEVLNSKINSMLTVLHFVKQDIFIMFCVFIFQDEVTKSEHGLTTCCFSFCVMASHF
jgi:hypothetical protein